MSPTASPTRQADAAARATEPRFSRQEAIRTPAFWLLMLYTVMVYPVQAGVSLHQAPHLIAARPRSDHGGVHRQRLLGDVDAGDGRLRIPAAATADPVSAGACRRACWRPARWLMPGVARPTEGFLAAGLFGLGIGAMLTLTPVAWADYFGRARLRRDPRLRAVGAGVGAGRRAASVRRLRLDRQPTLFRCSAFPLSRGLGLIAALAAVAIAGREDV